MTFSLGARRAALVSRTWAAAALPRATAVLDHQDRWVALTVGAMLGAAANGLWWLVAHADRVGLASELPLAITAACVYTAMTALVAVRRRIDRPTGVIIVIALLALMLAEGTTYPDASLRWVCLAFLTVLPLLTVVLLGRRGAAAATAASVAVALVIAAGLPATVEVRTYVASTMATLVCVPVLVVGVLVAQLQRARAAAHTAAITDQLTGLLNRRGLLDAFPRLLAAADASGEQVTLTLVDLDHFKRVNDGWGHAAGDQVLVRTAHVLSAAVRSGDLLVRHGGEELVWVARHNNPAEAVLAAERARAAIAAAGTDDVALPMVTASFGVAATDTWSRPTERPGQRCGLDQLLADADAALYQAKEAGRDRVIMAEPATPLVNPALDSALQQRTSSAVARDPRMTVVSGPLPR